MATWNAAEAFILNATNLQEVLRLIFVSSSGLKLWKSYEHPLQIPSTDKKHIYGLP